MTLFPRSNLPETDPAARWLEHYEAVEKQREAGHRRHRLPPPGLRRRPRAVALLIVLAMVLAGAASAVLWL